MKNRPSEALRRIVDEALDQVMPGGLRAVADRAAEEIAWMHGYQRRLREAMAARDEDTFVDIEKELEFARGELIALVGIYQDLLKLPWT